MAGQQSTKKSETITGGGKEDSVPGIFNFENLGLSLEHLKSDLGKLEIAVGETKKDLKVLEQTIQDRPTSETVKEKLAEALASEELSRKIKGIVSSSPTIVIFKWTGRIGLGILTFVLTVFGILASMGLFSSLKEYYVYLHKKIIKEEVQFILGSSQKNQ